MKSPLILLATTLVLPVLGSLTLHERDNPSVLTLDIQRKDVADPVARDRSRRKRGTTTVSEVLDNEATLYYCNVSLGTPEQSLRLVLDTGSSDLWCNAPSSTVCSSQGDPCSLSGTYDSSASSTYSFVSSDFNISYADTSGASGDYVTDTLHIGGATLQNFQFGVGFQSSSPQGVLGIGYPANEAQVGRNGGSAYANLPKAMVQKGLIKSNAYSLWLNDLNANTGSILFGGVNTDKYHGTLETLPIEKVDGLYSEFILALTAVTLSSPSESKSYSTRWLPAGVLLDSGSSLTYLPDPVVAGLFSDLGVTYDSSSGVGYVPCSLAETDIKISFTFTSPTINVAANELVLDAGNQYFQNGQRACVFGIVPAGRSTAVLGDTFLRSAYVVYDLTNNEISLANTNFYSMGDNILELGTGPDAVPGATAVANPVTGVAVAGVGAHIGVLQGGSGIFTSAPASKNVAAMRSPNMFKHLVLGLAGAGALLAF